MIERRDGRPQDGGGWENAVTQAWEKFLMGDDQPGGAVRRMVEDSWRRCHSQGVAPVGPTRAERIDDNGLHALQNLHHDLIEAARPVMAQARQFLTESGTVMVLTDPGGVILWMEGDCAVKDRGQDIALVPGAPWDESAKGTNAIGTAIAAGQPVQIFSTEHFWEGIKLWTCSAAVIHDPFDGAIIGALDISGLSGAHNNHCLALAVAGAGRIETRLAATEMERRSRLLDLTVHQPGRWTDSGMVVFDRRGRLVKANEKAGLFLNARGLELSSCNRLDLDATHNECPHPMPDWMSPDWLEPVIDHNERLGTILAFPQPARRMTAVALPEWNDRAGGKNGADDPFSCIVGASAVLEKVKQRARQLAKLQVPVLLLGPTGAGKEVFSRALHRGGNAPSSPFVPLNCGGMSRDLLAGELFGYVDGAFTGARKGGMIGKFEAANGGVLFLDEIGEMPLELQAHFLRVLEEGEVYRLGDTKARKVKVRLIAATNRDLRAEVEAGRFRMDLYYRLAVTVLHLPALSDHLEDIPLLVRYFVDRTAENYSVPARYPTHETLERLLAYPWPGNVRELRNVVESMVLLATGEVLTLDDLPPELTGQSRPRAAPPTVGAVVSGSGAQGGEMRLVDSERAAIIAAAHAEGGNLTLTATRLGIAKSTLYGKIKRLNIDVASLRPPGR